MYANKVRTLARVAPSTWKLQMNKNTSTGLCVHCLVQRSLPIYQVRWYQKPPQKKSLFGNFIENLKDGIQRDKQLQENLKQFQKESRKVADSDVVKDAKERMSLFGTLKRRVAPATDKIEETVKEATESLGKVVKDTAESEFVKKSQEITKDISKGAQEAAAKISAQGEELSKTEIGQQATKVFTTVKSDLLQDLPRESRPYQRPEKLKRRTRPEGEKKAKVVEADDDTQDVVLHKDSKWQAQWKDFRDNNAVVTGIFSLKTKYDESDNVAIRTTRFVTDKLSDIFSDVFSQSEMAQTIAEITKIDPEFNKDNFMKELEFEIIPTVLEAYLSENKEILRDWCHDGAYNVLSALWKNNETMGIKNHSQLLDIRDVDLAVAKIMEQGPVFVITFQAQQTHYFTDRLGNVKEGGKNDIHSINYVWAVCRDQNIFEHRAAWKVLEFAMQNVNDKFT